MGWRGRHFSVLKPSRDTGDTGGGRGVAGDPATSCWPRQQPKVLLLTARVFRCSHGCMEPGENGSPGPLLLLGPGYTHFQTTLCFLHHLYLLRESHRALCWSVSCHGKGGVGWSGMGAPAPTPAAHSPKANSVRKHGQNRAVSSRATEAVSPGTQPPSHQPGAPRNLKAQATTLTHEGC